MLNNTNNGIILFKVQKKIQKHKSKSFKIPIIKQCCYQNVLYVVLKKSRFIKEQEAIALLSSLGIKTPLSKIPLLGNILF